MTATVGTDFALPGSLHSPLRGSLSDSNELSAGWSSRRVLPLPPIAMSRVAPDDSGLASPLPENETNGESSTLNANVLSTALTAVRGDLPKPSAPNTTEERCRSEDVRTENLDDDEHKGWHSNSLHSHRSMRVSRSGSSISLASSRANRAARKKKLADIQGEPEWPDPKKYNHTTEFLMTLKNPIRRACIRGIEWPWWDRIVLGLIFLNTIQLALYNPIVKGNAIL